MCTTLGGDDDDEDDPKMKTSYFRRCPWDIRSNNLLAFLCSCTSPSSMNSLCELDECAESRELALAMRCTFHSADDGHRRLFRLHGVSAIRVRLEWPNEWYSPKSFLASDAIISALGPVFIRCLFVQKLQRRSAIHHRLCARCSYNKLTIRYAGFAHTDEMIIELKSNFVGRAGRKLKKEWRTRTGAGEDERQNRTRFTRNCSEK